MQTVELVWPPPPKQKPKVARKDRACSGWSRQGAEPPNAGPAPRAGLKDWCRGGRGAERAAAVAAARLPAPEHAREPPRSPQPPRPRRPAPRRQVSPAPGKEAGGRGGKWKGMDSGCQAGLRGCVVGSRPPRPWPPPAPPWQHRARGDTAAQLFSCFCPNRPDEAPIPGLASRRRPSGSEPRTGWPEPGQASPWHLSPCPPLTQTLSLLESGLRPQRAPTAWKCSADWEAHFLDEPTEAQRGRADFVLCPPPVRVIGSNLSPTPAQPHPDSPLTASVSPHQRTPGRYGPPLRLAPRVGW